MGSLIKNISKDQNTQILVSTHSLSLTANFEPNEIIRVNKTDGETVIKQDVSISTTHFRRFVHQDNAEIFFSDRVLFVEGPTEKHLFGNLDKLTKLNPTNPDSINCNFDRINLGVIRLDSVDSILNYVKITKAFDIPYLAIVDKDFIDDPSKQNKCKELCVEVGVSYQVSDKAKLISDLKSKNIVVNSKGEIEDIFSDQEITNITGRQIADIQAIKSRHTKTSKAFKEIFGVGKAEYAIVIADFYSQNAQTHPLADVIRNIYNNNIPNISI